MPISSNFCALVWGALYSRFDYWSKACQRWTVLGFLVVELFCSSKSKVRIYQKYIVFLKSLNHLFPYLSINSLRGLNKTVNPFTWGALGRLLLPLNTEISTVLNLFTARWRACLISLIPWLIPSLQTVCMSKLIILIINVHFFKIGFGELCSIMGVSFFFTKWK